MSKLRSWYIVIANTAILIVVLQVAAYLTLRIYYAVVAAMPPTLSEPVQRNYAHMSAGEQAELFRSHKALRFTLIPPVIVYGPIRSRFLNIDQFGIRANGQELRPVSALEGATWFLGGSTTFGEIIADHETLPAHLERVIGTPVVNLGVSSYASANENELLVHHLRAGYRPARVLFLDGINESCQPFLYEDEMRELFRRAQVPIYWDAGGPLAALVTRGTRAALRVAALDEQWEDETGCTRDGKSFTLAAFHAHIMGERAALCRQFALECHTLVQPFAAVHGPTAGLPPAFVAGAGPALADMFHHLEPNWKAFGSTFITDALDGYPTHPFVDEVHYSADANRVIAGVIAKRLGLP